MANVLLAFEVHASLQPLEPGSPAPPGFVADHAAASALSPDGATLLVVTSGYNLFNGPDGNVVPSQSSEYVFVFPGAVSLRGYAETVASWFGSAAQLKFLPYDEWKKVETPEDAAATWEHIARSPSSSIAKAERLIGYRPRYTSFEAVRESLAWLVEEGIVKTG